MCCACMIIYIYINPYSQILVYIQYIQLAWPCFVYLWVLRSAPICSCVCVICLRQATALRGARLQTLHWDETPATGLRPEPWHTNTYTHTQMERPRLPRTKQSLEHRPCRVTFRCFSTVRGKQKGKKKKNHLKLWISCRVWILCRHAATTSPNWLVLVVHRGGTFVSSITTVFIMLLVRREKSLLILILKSSFEHLLSECHVWI